MKKIFKNKKVTIMGLGLHGGGGGVAKFFCQQGTKVLITDLKTKKELKDSIQKLKGFPVEYILGRHREKDFVETDLVIKNPDVPKNSPYLKIAKRHNVPVKSDVAIFFELCRSFIIGITGTKGKSTVATLIYKFLKTKYPNIILAGNIGRSPLEILSKTNKNTKVVLELSSFGLEDLEKSPNFAVITNIYPDHLNRYKNLKEYITAKKRIFLKQRKKDVLILNYDNFYTKRLFLSAPSRIYFYSKKSACPPKFCRAKPRWACFVKNKRIFFNREGKPICKLKDLKIEGEHNISNTLSALSVAKLFKVSSGSIKNVLKKFKGVSSRQEFIKKIKGVKYFNDTTATMPEATISAIKLFREKFPVSQIILIAGGVDKNLNYKNLAKEIQKKINYLILLPGTASKKIKRELKLRKIKIFSVKSMKEAVKRAKNIAQRGDVVLLSPAAASFNLFKNEFDRGEQFNKAVKKI